MNKKTIKLINNERINPRITAERACSTSIADNCTQTGYDYATCISWAYDKCGKDYTGCREGAHDICTYVDDDRPCSGSGVVDTCGTDIEYNPTMPN